MARIKLTLIYIGAFAILITPLQLYQYQKGLLNEALARRDSLIATVYGCIDGLHEMRVEFNDGVDWVIVKCVEIESNLYPKQYRAIHKRRQQCAFND